MLVRQLRRLDKLADALTAGESRSRALFADNPLPMWVFDVESLKFL
jgi:hypothetical protein